MSQEDDILKAADAIVYGAEEEYVKALTDTLIDDFVAGLATGTVLVTLEQLARVNRGHITQALLEHKDAIDDDVMETIQDVLGSVSVADAATLARLYGNKSAAAKAAAYAGEIGHQTARGLAEIVARQNLALSAQAENAWYQVTGDAITARNLGLKPLDKIIAEGVQKLSDAGISTIDYSSGISNQIDVAIRRHVVSQSSQAGGKMTLQRLEAYGHDLVLVSAHYGARPSHAEWQGRVYSLSGKGGYPDFYTSTGYGTVTGLQGVNCRHTFGPYYPGITELPDLDFPLETGHFNMTSEEYYEAMQRQRELERRIRKTKREIAAMERAGLDINSPSLAQKRLVLGRQQLTMREHVSETGLVRQPKREKAYGIGVQPRALTKPR